MYPMVFDVKDMCVGTVRRNIIIGVDLFACECGVPLMMLNGFKGPYIRVLDVNI